MAFGITPYVAGGKATYLRRDGGFQRTGPGGASITVEGDGRIANARNGQYTVFNGAAPAGTPDLGALNLLPGDNLVHPTAGRPGTRNFENAVRGSAGLAPTEPGADVGQDNWYGQTHTQNWMNSLARQRNQRTAQQGTFAADRNAGIDRKSAGMDAYAAGQAALLPSVEPPLALSGQHIAGHVISEGDKLVANPNFDPSRPVNEKFNPREVKIRGGTHVDYGPNAPTTAAPAFATAGPPSPRSAPAPGASGYSPSDYGGSAVQPMPSDEPTHTFGDSGGSPGANQITTQAARQMWHNYLQQNAPHLLQGGNNIGEKDFLPHQQAFIGYLQSRYGVDPAHADSMMRQWADQGASGQGAFVRTPATTRQVAPTAQATIPPDPSTGRGGVVTLPNGSQVAVSSTGQRVGDPIGHVAPLLPSAQAVPAELGPERGSTPINSAAFVRGQAVPAMPMPTATASQQQPARSAPPAGQPANVTNAPQGSVARSKTTGKMYVRTNGAWVVTN